MATIYIGVGSNIDRERNIASGLQALSQYFSPITSSSVFSTAAVGFDGDEFYNLVVRGDTDLDADGVYEVLKEIETTHGRDHREPKYSSRLLDLDLLLIDDLVINGPRFSIPRDDVLEYAFVLYPLTELAPDCVHPVTGVTFAEHWKGFRHKNRLGKDVTEDVRDSLIGCIA